MVKAKKAEPAVATGEQMLVPLSKLRESLRNTRPMEEADWGLAQSIARVGLIQSLGVVPSTDGAYEVVAGGRRLAALRLLQKKRRIKADHAIPCLVVAENHATAISLAENVVRREMHPVDQIAAFLKLQEEGRSVEDIAADFSVSPLVVQRRLKLACLSPRLLDTYRVGQVSVEQLMALTLADGHEAQEAAYFGADEHWGRSAQALRRRILGGAEHAGTSRLVQFVGIETYEGAGGEVRRDLFADEGERGYATDVSLLERLASERLAVIAKGLEGEGHAWIDVHPNLSRHEVFEHYRRVPISRRSPDAETEARLSQLINERDAEEERIEVGHEDGETGESDDEDEWTRLEEEIQAVEKALEEPDPRCKIFAGALVRIGDDGAALVERGLLRLAEKDQWEVHDEPEGVQQKPEVKKSKPTHSAALVQRLTTHRTVALQAELANSPQAALAVLANKMAHDLLGGRYWRACCLEIRVLPFRTAKDLTEEVGQSRAGVQMDVLKKQWRDQLPEDPEQWFQTLIGWDTARLTSFLAVLVAMTVNDVQEREDSARDETAFKAVDPDLRQWWSATPEGYFSHVSKAQTLDVVNRLAPQNMSRAVKLKKDALAQMAAKVALDGQWLPSIMRRSGEFE